ncbi:Orthopoxvirus protein of uncharacterised function (DUF830) [Porphyromonas macacae]|uniref:Orthopoxvirus protein of uncharacterized function (DUF830) n=1 Tax=Porphyromonas macacae TaxID=28115 RepID=A0A379E7R7_9PORP|nr:YiiX/YebB-like N1pC/P60 family cysteine hydrolase [Porphyromonas macacae]SUB88743.1 Orthopoxvirus protein of uncharacterised function (DUF830) [Porphyromonas macacae]
MVGAPGVQKVARIHLFIPAVFIILAFCACNAKETGSKKNVSQAKSEKHFAGLSEGDLVCRLGSGFFSNHFRKHASQEKRFSHIGIISREGEHLYVYHTEASELTGQGGVKKESLETFLKGLDTYAFYRLELPVETKLRIIAQAELYFREKVPFDLAFDTFDDRKMYCTEFVARCINKACDSTVIVPALTINGKSFIGLDDIYKHPLCREVS